MFQEIDLQNLEKLRHQEGHHFRFQIWVFENLEKSENWQGPLASGTRQPMASCPGQRMPMHAWWLGHRPPPRASAVDRPPPPLHVHDAPLSRVAATSRLVPLLFLYSRQASAPLCSASRLAFLFQALSTAAGRHCCRIMHLCVVIDWGSAHQTGHHSEPTGRCPSRRSPLTRLHRPPPRTSTTSVCTGPPPASSPPS
jgi:hypothetical protein